MLVSLIIGWIMIALALLFLPRRRLNSGEWLPEAKFSKKYPNLAPLTVIFPLLHIICVPAVIIWAGRTWQTADSGTFFLAIIFYPLAVVGLLKGLLEISFGVSAFLGFKTDKRRALNLRPLSTAQALASYQHKFMRHLRHVRSVGALRLMFCLLVLSWLPSPL